MGTRADFYIETEWIGSVAFDGYKWDEQPDSAIMQAKTKDEFREAVKDELSKRGDSSLPEHGWPWPWEDSTLSDYAYRFEDGNTKAYCWGCPVEKDDNGNFIDTPKREDWPDMTDSQNVTYGKRSGLMVFHLS